MISRLVRLKRKLRRKFGRTNLVARLLNRNVAPPDSDEPGLVILQIDGLARNQLEAALAAGRMPALKKMIARGHYSISSFYSGLPSTTPAVQGEVMFGVRTAVPAFQFVDRQSGKTRLMFEEADARAVASMLAEEGRPLLEGGRSYSNIYAGGAAEARLCAETMDLPTFREMLQPRKVAIIVALYSFKILRIAGLAALEFVIALGDMIAGLASRQHWRAELHAVNSRVLVSIVLREWARAMVKLSIAEGAPIIFANFLGHDEQAHRRGPGSWFAHWGLKGIDNVIGDVLRAAHTSDARDYQVIVYSDHGQEHTRIYDNERGRTIQDAVKRVVAEGPHAGRTVHAVRPSGDGGAAWRDQLARRRLHLQRGRQPLTEPNAADMAEAVVVTALGPLGHVYFPVELGDQEKDQYARALVRQEHVPLVLYRDAAGEVHAQNRTGAWRLPEDAVPVFGPRHSFVEEATADLIALCKHRNAGDLIVSGWDSELRPMTFVHENGAHGSIGVDETRGFALVPDAVRIRRRRSASGEVYSRGQDLHRAAWNFVHPDRPLDDPQDEQLEQPRRPGDGSTIRVMTYNIHSCIGLDGRSHPQRIARVIHASGADVIALQEVDAYRSRSRRDDQARLIAERLGMHYQYYAISQWGGEQYGLAVLSRFPMELLKADHLTPADHTRRCEARGAMWVRVETPAGPLHVVNTHFGLRRDERLRQTGALLGPEWLGSLPADAPLVLCGDFNAGPRSPAFRQLAGKLVDVHARTKGYRPRSTFFSPMPFRRLDHIFVNANVRSEPAMALRSPTAAVASDHLPVCADVTLGPPTARSAGPDAAQERPVAAMSRSSSTDGAV